MEKYNLRKKAGQLFAVGFHGQEPSPEIKHLIHEYGIGAIVLFRRNIRDAAQLQSLTLALQQEAKSAGHEYPLLIGIDQENGLVTRICPPIAAQLPGPMTLGATQSPELAYKISKGTGDLLNYFGINMNYAPVCDVNSEPLNPVIGVRSPGDDPDFVGRFASAAAQGLRDCKIVPSAKHFPGHGDTAVDSHYGLPAIFKDRDQLERWELVPFRRCVAEGVETVMTAHIALPAIGDGDLPATLSADALNILRKDMNYDGMIVSDCLEMDGVRATYGTERGSVLALNAGCDSIMICHTYDVQLASVERVVDAVQCGVISASRLEQAFNRVQRVKETFTDWETALRKDGVENLASINKENEALAKEAYSQSATLVRSKPGVLPLSSTCKVVLLLPGGDIPAGGAVDGEGMGRKGSYKATYYTDILRSHNAAVVEIRYGPAGLSTEQWNSVTAADAVVLITINAMESPYQRSLGLELSKRSQAVVAVAACSPYDFLEDFDIDTYIATYEPTAEAFKAVADVIFGVASARGSLPVTSKSADNKSVTVAPLVPEHDLDREATIWNAALPNYALPKESLQRLLAWPSGCHFVARVGYTTAGLCIAYAKPEENGVGHIAVVVVEPPYQNKGVGTALLMETKSYFRRHFNVKKLVLGSTIPRFWPGIPEELLSEVHEFFVHRGFRALPDDWSRDLYRDIRNFQAPEEYVTRARDEGYTFCPLRPEHHRECVVAQMKNFSTYDGWVGAYQLLDPQRYPSSVMVAFDSKGRQVGWTLMLSPSSPLLQRGWAFPPLCGPQTGLIACVGVDASYRFRGIGLALVSHAVENMKERGVERVFIDWVAMEGYYEKLGFETWRSYQHAEAWVE